MIELNSEAIRDYQVCALYYKLYHIDQEPIPIPQNKLFIQRYHNTIKRVIAFYFLRRQAESAANYNLLLSKWEKLWFPKGTDAFDLTVESQDKDFNSAHYTTLASKALSKFFDKFKTDEGYPLLVDEDFIIPLNRGIKLNGSFDLVLEYPKNKVKIIKWIFDKGIPITSDYMFNMSIQKMAWEYRNIDKNKSYDAQYYLYDLSSAAVDFIPMLIGKQEINTLHYWAYDIAESQHYIPRRGFTIYCKGCPFDKTCAEFQFPDKENIND